MTKDEILEINKCKCGETAVVEEFEFDADEYSVWVYVVECPVCGRRSRPYTDEDEAICAWNGVEYKPYVEPPRERTEEEKEWDKRWARYPNPLTSILSAIAGKQQNKGYGNGVIYNWRSKLEEVMMTKEKALETILRLKELHYHCDAQIDCKDCPLSEMSCDCTTKRKRSINANRWLRDNA